MSDHAILSASGSSRWIACTPSARLEMQFASDDDEPSPSAEEGSLAHKLAETILKRFNGDISDEAYRLDLRALRSDPIYCQDMMEYVSQYVNEVETRLSEALADDDCANLQLECDINFSKWVPHGFGRCDALIMSGNTLQVFDLKYGQHISVSAHNNPQIRLYALGALEKYRWLYSFSEVKMYIIQPRKGGVSKEYISVRELLEWAETIKPIARKAYFGEGQTVAGKHCRFCLAAPRCKALADYSLAMGGISTTKDPRLLNDSEVAAVLACADDLVNYTNKVKSYALDEALNGKKWPGFKLVAGKGRSSYSEPSKIIKILLQEGYKESDFMKAPELMSATALKRLISTKKFNELLSNYMEKSEGRPQLVFDSDKRPELDLADGFDNLDKLEGAEK